METEFKEDILKRKKKLEEYNKTANIITIFKMAFFILICYSCYNIYRYNNPRNLIILLIGEVVIFVIACLYHKSVYDIIHKQEGIIQIDEANIKRLKGEWSDFKDIGEEFIDYNHNYATDLDIVGKNSLFQMLNTTGTYYGRHKFANDLLYPDFSKDDLEKRHEAIKELKENYSFSVEAEYDFSLVGVDNDFPNLVSELQNKKRFIKNYILKKLFKITSLFTCLSFLYAVITMSSLSLVLTNCFIIIQILLWGIGYVKSNSYVGVMKKLSPKISKYNNIINQLADNNFTSEKLREIDNSLKDAKIGIKELSKIATNINYRQNGAMCIILNILLLWDYKNAIDLDNWKQKYADSIGDWFDTLGELESLMSFANLPRICNNMSLPTLIEENNKIKTINLGHPLISNDIRVCNDFVLDNNIYIISGSNMSGKTTFMRTLGINMVLASAGSYVCAMNMTFSKMEIITSMRIRDDLSGGISTFYAELKRIKKIVDLSHKNPHTLFLIDEIFRGTNSVDRLKGAEGVLKELCKLDVSGMITTHDLEVCNLETENKNIINCSFNEHYIDGEIFFDYKLKNGRSQTTNAEYLLRKVGIIS